MTEVELAAIVASALEFQQRAENGGFPVPNENGIEHGAGVVVLRRRDFEALVVEARKAEPRWKDTRDALNQRDQAWAHLRILVTKRPSHLPMGAARWRCSYCERVSCGKPDLLAIKARLAQNSLQTLLDHGSEDLAALVAEVERLREENLMLKRVAETLASEGPYTHAG